MAERPKCETCNLLMGKNGKRQYMDGSIVVRYRCSICGYTCEVKEK
jgi:rubrerythrin